MKNYILYYSIHNIVKASYIQSGWYEVVSSGLVFILDIFRLVSMCSHRDGVRQRGEWRDFLDWREHNMYRDWKWPIRPVLMIDHHFMAGFLKSIVTRDPSRNRLANLRGNVVPECGNCVLSQWGEGGRGWHLWNWKKVLLSLLALCQVGGGDSWLPRTLSLRTSLDDVIINVSRIIPQL